MEILGSEMDKRAHCICDSGLINHSPSNPGLTLHFRSTNTITPTPHSSTHVYLKLYSFQCNVTNVCSPCCLLLILLSSKWFK